MSFYDVTSEMVGKGDRFYGIAYAPKIRRQWMLQCTTPGLCDVAAYFRTEAHALAFAESFGLELTDHRLGTGDQRDDVGTCRRW